MAVLRPALRPVLVYILAAIVTTWPLAVHPASLLGAPIGAGDPYLNLWILGWGLQAIVSNPLSVLTGRVFDANIFYPAAGTLAYSDHLLLQSAALAPLYAITGNVVVCYNALLFASLVGSALAMHLFVRRVVGTTGGAYIAGLAWGFGSFRFAHLLHLQLQSLYFLPLTFLALHRLIAGRRRRDAVILGILAGLQAIASVYYAVIGGVALIVGAVALMLSSSRRGRSRLMGRLVLAAVVAGALAFPVGLVYWRVQQREGFGRNLYEAGRNAAFVDSYLQVPPGNLLYGRTGLLRSEPRVDARGVPHTGPERELFPGFVLLVLAVAGVWFGWRSDSRPVVVTMVAVGVTGFLLSLGPDGVRVVYATLHRYVFGFQAIRAPARFSVLAMFAVCALAALGWRELSSLAHGIGQRRPFLATAAIVAVALECAHVPVTLVAAPALHTAVGAWLASAPGKGAVAVLPLGIDIENTPAMVQSLEHRRPLLNGYSGQRPAFYASLVDAIHGFPSEEALIALHESGVRFIVTPAPVPQPPDEVVWPLVQRAQFPEASIYELQWTDEVDARFAKLVSVTPPPPGPVPFGIGEEARYTVGWDGGGMNLTAGEVVVTVEPPQYRFVVTATTAPWVARFFEANDRFSTQVDGALLPTIHERDQQEGARHVTRSYVYDRKAGVVRTARTTAEAEEETAVSLPLAPEARDAIAALFYARTLALEPGTRVRMPVNEAGSNLVLSLQVTAREQIMVNGTSVAAIRLEPAVERRVEIREPLRAVVWLSEDARRVPLAVDIAAPFGHLRMELRAYRSGRQ